MACEKCKGPAGAAPGGLTMADPGWLSIPDPGGSL